MKRQPSNAPPPASAASAQDGAADDEDLVIGEVIVTAQKRRESSTDVGIAMSVLSADALAAQRVGQVTDLAGRTPNLDIKEQVPGTIPVITIRGVGLNDFGAANNPSASVYVDQVYVASIAMMSFDFYDLERIEVLKGPQGTLYGRNSTAGAINIISKKPHYGLEAYTSIGYGNYDTIEAEGALNTPLGASAALRFSAKSIQQSEGYWDSRTLSSTCTPGFVGPVSLTAVDTRIDDRNGSWRLGLEYQPADARLLYATVSRGTKSGGFFSGISTTNLQLDPFAPEELTAYEVGFKGSFAKLYLGASAFHYDYGDIQTFVAVDIGPFIIQRLGNVSDARVDGVELEAMWAPLQGLALQANIGWLDTELGSFATLTGVVPKGNELPNSPQLTAGLLARYEANLTRALSGLIQVDASYADAVFKDAINDPVIAADSYTIVNARLGVFSEARDWEAMLWGKNLGEERYVVHGLNTGLGAGNRNFNAPRTYGVSFTYRWR